jgi:hypothetical protein
MKSRFVAGGYGRFLRGRNTASWEAIQRKYAGELATASPLQKLRIRKQMAQELLNQKNRGHKPSPGTLW